MKFFFLFLFVFISVVSNGQTSVYHTFPDSAAMWNIDSYQNCGLGFDRWQHLYSIKFSGDTIIGSVSYHKLEVPIEMLVSNGACTTTGAWTIPGNYAGCIRQDTVSKKVFFVPPSNNTEELLYDFNLAVGDTVKGYLSAFVFPTEIVDSVDSVLVGTDYRKRWNIDPCYGIYIIEGIGSTYGLFERFPGCTTDRDDFNITCFKQNGTSLFPSTATNCELITNELNPPEKNSKIIISPNPFHTATLLQVTSEFENSKIQIYNAFGSLICEDQFFTQNTFVLKKNELRNGLYFIRITNKNGQVAINKLIIN